MILRQFLHSDPVAASYLFGCGGKASAAVVDPVGDIRPYLEAAEGTGVRILYVIDTHVHARSPLLRKGTRASLGWRVCAVRGRGCRLCVSRCA